METEQLIKSGIEAEFGEVRRLMIEVTDGLEAPLHQLVRARIDQAEPLLRAGVVLAAAVNDDSINGPASTQLMYHRIHLAAALEMLHVAHNIHKLLLVSESDEMDASVMGSTILAGDFCFSHAAILAASTDNPDVVAIFAQALKTVSENNLKGLFGDADIGDENHVLFVAGVQAATKLAQLTTIQQEIMIQYIDLISGGRPNDFDVRFLPIFRQNSEQLTLKQQQRWRHLFAMTT